MKIYVATCGWDHEGDSPIGAKATLEEAKALCVAEAEEDGADTSGWTWTERQSRGPVRRPAEWWVRDNGDIWTIYEFET